MNRGLRSNARFSILVRHIGSAWPRSVPRSPAASCSTAFVGSTFNPTCHVLASVPKCSYPDRTLPPNKSRVKHVGLRQDRSLSTEGTRIRSVLQRARQYAYGSAIGGLDEPNQNQNADRTLPAITIYSGPAPAIRQMPIPQTESPAHSESHLQWQTVGPRMRLRPKRKPSRSSSTESPWRGIPIPQTYE